MQMEQAISEDISIDDIVELKEEVSQEALEVTENKAQEEVSQEVIRVAENKAQEEVSQEALEVTENETLPEVSQVLGVTENKTIDNITVNQINAKVIYSDKKVYRILDNFKLSGNHTCSGLSLVKYNQSYEVSRDNVFVYFKKEDLVICEGSISFIHELLVSLEKPKYVTKIDILSFDTEKLTYGSKEPLIEKPFYRIETEEEQANNGPLRTNARYIFLTSIFPCFIELGNQHKKTLIGYNLKSRVFIKDLNVYIEQGDKIKVIYFKDRWLIL
jgi:hypothetical protein